MADLRGTVDDDLVIGTGADDFYFHDGGDDTVNGAGGFDRLVLFSAGTNQWLVDLAAGTADFSVDRLSIANFESATLTGSNGVLQGDAGANDFVAYGNGALIEGRGGERHASLGLWQRCHDFGGGWG